MKGEDDFIVRKTMKSVQFLRINLDTVFVIYKGEDDIMKIFILSKSGDGLTTNYEISFRAPLLIFSRCDI